VRTTIENWCKKAFTNLILNHIWKFFPGLLLWETWKECNKKIFNDTQSSIDGVWGKIKTNFMETLWMKTWFIDDWKADDM